MRLHCSNLWDLDVPEPPGVFPEGNFVSEFCGLVAPWAPHVQVGKGLGVGCWEGAGWSPVDTSSVLQADLYVMTRLLGYVDISDPRFVAAVLAITFNPLFWNVVSALTLTLARRVARTDTRLALPTPRLSLACVESSSLLPH